MTQVRTPPRQPRGWERIVSEVSGAADARTFFRAMLDLQCKIVAAEYGSIWAPASSLGGDGSTEGADNAKLQAVELWPETFAQSESAQPLLELMGQAAMAGMERQTSQVLRIDSEGVAADPNGAGAHIFVTILRADGKIVGVSTVVADCRDASVVQSTAPLRELAAGLTEGFAARQDAQTRAADAMLVRRAMAVLSTTQDGKGFSGASLNLVNEMARQLKCSRVSLGWIKGKGVRLEAMSDTEHVRRHSAQVGELELAMAECLDQQQPIVCPVPEGAEPVIAHAVLHAHRKVTGNQPNRYILSIPLRQRDEWVGVLTLERSDEAFDSTLIRQMQLIADVVAPHLADRRQADRWLHHHVGDDVLKAGSYLLGPRHVAWKLLGVAVLIALIASLLIHMDYRVSADFVLEAQSKRIVPSPFEGILDKALTEPGKPVRAGDVLAELSTTEQSMQLAEAQAKLKLSKLQRDQSLAERKQAEAAQAAADAEALAARVAMLEHQIEKSKVRAPIDGIVLSGYWQDKVGGVVEQGKEMFQIAPLSDLIAIVRVGEADIDYIQPGQEGYLATRSAPEAKFHIKVTRIVPMASPVNGANVFEVWSEFQGIDAQLAPVMGALRPGMEGLAKIHTESRSLAWIATHKLADLIRLYVWW
jgi:multidrug efflux pump subunit AcrA (membrane-fusion protein)/GAF domain-containing protein